MSSISPSALAPLNDGLTLFCESLGRLKTGQPVNVEEVIEQLKMAAESSRNLHDSVLSEMPEACWKDQAELDTILEEIQERAQARELEQRRARLLALAAELEGGRITHRRPARLNQMNQLRDQAIKELQSQAGLEGSAQTLPGPGADQWIAWACALKEPEDAELLQTLRNGFAGLDEFIANLEPEMWIAKTAPEPASQDQEELDALLAEELRKFEQEASVLGSSSSAASPLPPDYRAEFNVPVMVRTKDGFSFKADARNLSAGGMGLRNIKLPLAVSDELTLTFKLPGVGREFTVEAAVVWCRPDGIAGTKFIRLRASTINLISVICRSPRLPSGSSAKFPHRMNYAMSSKTGDWVPPLKGNGV